MHFGKYCILLIFLQCALKSTVSVEKLSKMHSVVSHTAQPPGATYQRCTWWNACGPGCWGHFRLPVGTTSQLLLSSIPLKISPKIKYAKHTKNTLIRKEWCASPEILLLEVKSNLFESSDNKEHRLKLTEDT